MVCRCKECDREYEYSRSKGHSKDLCNSCRLKRRREVIREKIREYVGGLRCTKCNYDKCEAAVVFHHRDPTEKKFSIRDAYCRSWKSIQKEIDKCDMLCSNCHAEEHWGLVQQVSTLA